MVSMPKGPKAWNVEKPTALQRADMGAWIYPVEGITHEAELREEFLDWASKRPPNLRGIRDGHSLFRFFIKEFMETPEGRLRVLEIDRRRYQLAYDEDYKFPGWSREKSLQMLRNIDRAINKVKAMLDDLESIRAAGFSGFISIRALRDNKLRDVPNEMGVYIVLRLTSGAPIFLEQSRGGHFKGKDPTVPVEELHRNWILGTPVIYIGKAGEPAGGATLRSRLGQYLAFGAGQPVSHHGGRLIWQLADAEDLVVCWKSTPTEDPREVEQRLIEKFKASHSGKRPFANLQD